MILKQERIKKEVNDRIKFGEEVMKNFQPQQNYKLKTQREDKIKKLKGVNKYKDIKNLDIKLKNISNKLVLSQPKNFQISNILADEEKKGKKIKILKPLEKPIDYLSEERYKKSKENKPKYKSYLKDNKWENMLNSDGNIYNNIEQVKMEAKLLQKKADTKKELLKNEATNINNIDNLNNEISNLYIGSIKAKLQILKKIEK